MFRIKTIIPKENMLFPNRVLMALIIPLIIEQFLSILIGIADTVMVTTISESAVSAISLVDSINILFIQLFSAMGTGGAVIAAQYIGKQDPLNASKAAKQLLYLSFAISLVFTLIAVFFCDPLLRLTFGALPEVTFQYCRTYLYLSALSYPAMALYNGGAALLRAMGDSKSSMYTSLLMNILNVGGNALLIYGFNMEVAGAGIASLASRMLGAVVVIQLLRSSNKQIRLIRVFHFKPDKEMLKRIIGQGIPNGLENSMFQIGKLMVTGIVASYSVSVIAANAISNHISVLFNLPGSAIGLALITVVGQCVGAGEIHQAKHYTVKLLKMIYGLIFLFDVILYFTARPLVTLFHLSPEGVDVAVKVLRFYAVSAAIFWPASFALPNALRAAGDAKFTMTVSVLSMWTFRIGFSYLLAYTFGLELLGVWIAMAVDWIARGICFVWRYRHGKWLEKKVV